MKKFYVVVFCVLAMVSVADADNLYLSGNLGFSMLEDSNFTDSSVPHLNIEADTNAGVMIAAALGCCFDSGARVEGEISYQKNDLDNVGVFGNEFNTTGDVTILSCMINSYYDFVNNTPLTPYINLGAGAAQININDFKIAVAPCNSVSEDDIVFAYQFGCGVGYRISKTVILDIKYRYFNTVDAKFDTATADVAGHHFLIGGRINF